MEQKLFFTNSKGSKLCGIVSDPTHDKSKPVIIMIHGFSSNKNTVKFTRLQDILNPKGISTFRFDIWGHGESKGKFEDITITEAVDDILCAIAFVKRQGYVKIGLLGSSFGGISSIMASSKSPDLFLLTLISPVSNYEEKEIMTKSNQELDNWKKDGFRYYETSDKRKLKLNYTFYKDFKNNDGYKAAPNINIPTLIVHGDADKTVPVSQSIKTSKLIPHCKLVRIKDADHRYTDEKHLKKLLITVSDFIIDHSFVS